jgi:beta-lactamase regulating signal transducer with metallopeptidase domain
VDDLLSIAGSNAVAATVLALVALAVGSVQRRPALLHGLWLLVLLKLVTPPLFYLPISWPATADSATPEIAYGREEAIAAEEPADIVILQPSIEEGRAGSRPRSEWKPDPAGEAAPADEPALGALTQPRSPMPPEPALWPQILSIVWGAGALAWFLLALERLHRFRRLLRFARPAPAALQERTRQLARSLGLRSCPRVRLLPGRIAPMLWAVEGPPRLLVPADLLAGLSDEQLDTLLVHELAHLRRRDHWVRILEFVVMGLYWWHPVVWYARRELREAEEQCCDAWVVSTLPDAGRTYASALLDTLDFLSATQADVPPLASGLGRIVDLKRRLTMIMRANTPRSLTWPGCLAVVVLGLAFLPVLPSLHGQAPGKEEASKSLDEAKKQLAAAQLQLEAAKAQLEMNKANLAAAQDQMKKAARDRQAVQLDKLKIHQLALSQIGQKRDAAITLRVNEQKGEGKSRVHIVIECDDMEGINVSDLGKKLKDLFPKKNAHISVAVDSGVRVLEKNAKTPAEVHTERMRVGEVRPTAKPGAVALPSVQIEKTSGNPEKRINDLEKKLEKVLQELQDLRKQMRQPRVRPVPPRSVTPPPAAGEESNGPPPGFPARPTAAPPAPPASRTPVTPPSPPPPTPPAEALRR